MRIAVVGGTGLIGRHVVEALEAAGTDVVVIGRRGGVDVTTGAGLDVALAGVQRIVDASNPGAADQASASAFFTSGARHLQESGSRAGADRLVVLSIVGIERVPHGYYGAKLDHERATREGRVPAVVVRSTQFHEFAGQVLTWDRNGDVVHVPEMLVQPVAAEAAAAAVVELTLADSAPALSEIGGPQVEQLVDLVALLAARRGDTRRVESQRERSADGDALATGALLPVSGARLLGPTFAEWLEAGERAPRLAY